MKNFCSNFTAIADTMRRLELKSLWLPTRKGKQCVGTGVARAIFVLASQVAAMAASDSSPAWAGCHEYTDLSTPGSASSGLFARDRYSHGLHGETRPTMIRIATSSVAWSKDGAGKVSGETFR